MASNSKQTATIRKRKASRGGHKRKKQLRVHGSTPSLAAILDGEGPGQAKKG